MKRSIEIEIGGWALYVTCEANFGSGVPFDQEDPPEVVIEAINLGTPEGPEVHDLLNELGAADYIQEKVTEVLDSEED
ncbi:MAG: hypothetical protein AB7U98_13740 [Candidatus Nitrosocosmicus sp.]